MLKQVVAELLRNSYRLFNTVRYLKIRQALALVRQRFLGSSGRVRSVAAVKERSVSVRRIWLLAPAPNVQPGEVEFLNDSRPFDISVPDWRHRGAPKLWRYNLHYFDYLHWPAYTEASGCALIHSWIESNPVGIEDAWEPYPVSLRIVNWIKFIQCRESIQPPPSTWLKSLTHQAAWLAKRVEGHLLANHLLVNGKALVFAGVFLEGSQGQAWLQKGLAIMSREAGEQFLSDGGHFERSFQYHCLVLVDYLDVLNLLLANPGFAGEVEVEAMRAAAQRGMGFLERTKASDGRIPLFNDSAFGIAPEPDEILRYGAAVLQENISRSIEPLRVSESQSGYFGYRLGGDSLLIDCGVIGPDYQPGHAHCDTLSYELCVDGLRFIVDSGVFDYEVGEMRAYVRSTAAHNTVRVDGQEQSEIWAAFRVARRARPLEAELSPLDDGALEFRGGHTGYQRLAGRVTHRRLVRAELAGRWIVRDAIEGAGSHRVENFIHLHPAVDINRIDDRSFLLERDRVCLKLSIDSAAGIEQQLGWYCPEFGIRQRNTVLVLRDEGKLPIEMAYTIERS